MKDLFKNGIIVLLIIGALYIIFLREYKHSTCPPLGQVLIPSITWDSIQELVHKPPVVTHDTFYLKGDVIYVQGKPVLKPLNNNDSIKIYSDSIINKDINVWVDLRTKGVLLDLKWEYRSVIKIIRVDSLVFVPQIVEKPVSIEKRGLFIYVTAGGNQNAFLFGGGMDFITKKNTELGLMYQRYGNVNFYSVKLGIPLKF